MVSIKQRRKFFGIVTILLSLWIATIACESEATSTRVVQGDTPIPTTANEDAQIEGAAESETLQEDAQAKQTPSPTTNATPVPVGNATVVVRSSNLRNGPGTSFSVIGSAKEDDVLPVYGKDPNGEWIQVDWNKSLWIHSSLVEINIDISTIPIVEEKYMEAAETPGDGNTQTLASPTVIQDLNTTITPTALVSNGRIEVFNITTHGSSDGGLVMYGEVRNLGETTIKRAEVTISLYDAGNNLLDTESSRIYTPWEHNLWNTGVLYPNNQAPFVLIINNPGDWVTFKTEIEFENARERDYSDHYQDLQIINDIGRSIDDFLYNYQVSGEIENTGSSVCGPIWIIATLYDEQGQVVGVNELLTDVERLNPGEIEPFKVQIFARGTVASYRLKIEAIEH